MNIKEEITIEGSNIHEVGYRVYLLRYAAKCGIMKFYAFNEEENGIHKVVIQVETSKEKIAAFIEYIHSSRPVRADVSHISRKPYDGEVYPLNEFRHELTLEQLTKGIDAILEIRDSNEEIKKSIQKIENNQRVMCTRQDTMIVKQEETITEVKGLRHEISTTFDQRLKRIEEEQISMKEAIRQLGATVR